MTEQELGFLGALNKGPERERERERERKYKTNKYKKITDRKAGIKSK
jgi:hypothetical protein